MGASPQATMYPFIATRGVLAQRMVIKEYTIIILQQMGIIATSGTCRQCQGDLEEQYKRSTNNKRYWWCSLRKLKLYLNLFLWFHDQKLTGKDVPVQPDLQEQHQGGLGHGPGHPPGHRGRGGGRGGRL